MLRDILLAFGPVTDLTPDDLAFFGARIWQILTSCDGAPDRRVREDGLVGLRRAPSGGRRRTRSSSPSGITRSLVAAKARKASTRTIGDIFVQLMLTILNPTEGSTDRVLDGPTNLVWIDPWLTHLGAQGVDYRLDTEVEEILCDGVAITGVAVTANGSADRVVTATTTWPRCRSSASPRW